MRQLIELTVNGQPYPIDVEGRTRLLDALRDKCLLTGAKEGCSTGDCGACTVLLDGKPVTSCLVLAASAADKEVTTIEGVASGSALHPVQRAFMDHGGLQCGICTPGMIMTSIALLEENPNPTRDEVRFGLQGNLCRCTGYDKIVNAVQSAARQMTEGEVANVRRFSPVPNPAMAGVQQADATGGVAPGAR